MKKTHNEWDELMKCIISLNNLDKKYDAKIQCESKKFANCVKKKIDIESAINACCEVLKNHE